jgi:integrase
MLCRKCKKDLPDGAVFCCWCGVKQEVKRTGRTRPNGAGTVYRVGKSWVCEVTLGYNPETGKRIRRRKYGFKTKTEALAYAPTLKNESANLKAYNLALYHHTWLQNADLSKSKETAYRIAWERLSTVAYVPIGDLDVSSLQSIINKQTTYYPARDIRTLLSHLFKLAIADQKTTVNLAQYLKLPKLEEESPEPFTEDELRALWSAYDRGESLVGYILLMIYTGMMPGELFIFRKDMIDWEKKLIIGCGLKTQVRKKTPMVIADCILPVLQRLCDETPGDKVLRMNRDSFYACFHDILQRYGCRDLTPYACRHTTATALALGDNIAPSVIQKVMRHSKFTTTQRYIHPDVSDALDAVNTLKKRTP